MIDETPLVLVEDRATLEKVALRLAASPIVAVDTESDSFHHYQEKVCLLQFSDPEGDIIVDPLACDNDMSPLAPVFANPNIVKVFHGADYDIVCLKRDYGFEIHNLFDTMISSQQLGLERVGLADLIGEFFGVDVDKKYQRHDWAHRPLLDEHIEYARGDTHWLLALREILTRRLIKQGRLDRVLEECRILERREWEGRRFDPDGWLRVKTGTVHLDDVSKRVLRRLWLYRDDQAKRSDRPPFKTIPDPVLVEVAAAQPMNDDELERLFPRSKSAMKRRFGAGFLEAVQQGLSDDFEIPKARAKSRGDSGPPGRLSGGAAERAMNALKDWRNGLIDASPTLNPMAVMSNGVMKNIVKARPYSIEELLTVPDVRQWQVEAYGNDILAVLDRSVPRSKEGEESSESDEGGPRKRRRRRGGR